MKNNSLFKSFKNAFNGLFHVIRSERNMRIHIAAVIIAIVAGILLKISKIELLIICLTAALVIICELFNTAIEVMTDIITKEYHPLAKIVKDVAAGAVLVSAILSAVVAYFIFFDKIIDLIK